MGIIAPRPRSGAQEGLKGTSSMEILQVLAGRRLTGHRKPGANGKRGAWGLAKCDGAPVHSPKASAMRFLGMGLALCVLKMKRAAASVPLESLAGPYISTAFLPRTETSPHGLHNRRLQACSSPIEPASIALPPCRAASFCLRRTLSIAAIRKISLFRTYFNFNAHPKAGGAGSNTRGCSGLFSTDKKKIRFASRPQRDWLWLLNSTLLAAYQWRHRPYIYHITQANPDVPISALLKKRHQGHVGVMDLVLAPLQLRPDGGAGGAGACRRRRPAHPRHPPPLRPCRPAPARRRRRAW